MVLATQAAFPAVRFHHRVFDADESVRDELIHFANALHGRSSAFGSHWWLGCRSFWQVCEYWAGKFDQEVFNDQLQGFIKVAYDRTLRFVPASHRDVGEDVQSGETPVHPMIWLRPSDQAGGRSPSPTRSPSGSQRPKSASQTGGRGGHARCIPRPRRQRLRTSCGHCAPEKHQRRPPDLPENRL